MATLPKVLLCNSHCVESFMLFEPTNITIQITQFTSLYPLTCDNLWLVKYILTSHYKLTQGPSSDLEQLCFSQHCMYCALISTVNILTDKTLAKGKYGIIPRGYKDPCLKVPSFQISVMLRSWEALLTAVCLEPWKGRGSHGKEWKVEVAM